MKPPKTKICTKCGKRKKLGEYGKHKGCPNGVGQCKQCVAAYKKINYRDNVDRYIAKSKAWHMANRERSNRNARMYYESHKEEWRAYYEVNRERINERLRADYKANPEKWKRWRDANYKRNKGKILARRKAD